MEKRAFKRHFIRLSGQCSGAHAASQAVEIMDFCPGGMLLSFSQSDHSALSSVLKLGNTIEVACVVPNSSGATTLQFHGRVVHESATSAGIAYLDPDFDALHLLYSYAKDHPVNPDPREADTATPPASANSVSGVANQTLIPVCKEIVGEALIPIARQFLDKVIPRLFDVVGTISSVTDKNACYDAMNVFKKHGEAFVRGFEAQMQDRLNTDLSTEKSAEPLIKEVTLSLVENSALEDWLSFSDTSHKLEEEFQDILTQLEQRLGVVFQTAIDRENNPFGPAAFSQAFQSALSNFTLERRALQVSYAIYKEVLSGDLGRLYTKLNQYLITQGVLPDLAEPSFKVKVTVNKGSKAKRAAEDIEDDESEAEAPSAASATKQNNATQAESAANITNQTAPPNLPAGTMQDWYQLVQSLGNFQQYASQLTAKLAVPAALASSPSAISPGASAPGVGAPAGAAEVCMPPAPTSAAVGLSLLSQSGPAAEPEYYSAEEMLRALSQVELTALPAPNTGATPATTPSASPVHRGIQTQLLTALAKISNSTQAKMLPVRSARALAVAENLFDSVLTDKLVSDNVRPWLQQLSLPIMKMAVRDDTVFSDKTHAARLLLDRISQLELYGEDASNQGMNAIRRRINVLLMEITEADEVTPALFSKVLKQIDLIIDLQNKAYEANVQDLAVACEAEEKLEKPVTDAAPAFSPTVIENPVFQEWQKKTKRLKVGDWLLLDVKSTQQRLRLAWIAQNGNRYVFVNVKGWKGATLSCDELAHQLTNGTAVVLDDGGEPLIDLAQYSMLQNMHSQLLHETTHDKLTGLVNRREFERRVDEALASARNDHLQHTLYIFNLNQFSLINSTFNYSSGDKLLVEISQLLRKGLSGDNVLSRIGGKEFGMLLENSTIEEALITANRHKEEIQAYRFTQDNKTMSISFSAALIPMVADSENVGALLQAAESSCHIAREKGTNHIQIYQADDTELTRHLQVVKWVSIIDAALDNKNLTLRHQPIVKINATGTTLFHSEVLLGVPDEHGKLISPTDFVLAAEHYRRMPAVDRWVIENTFRWMIEHPAQLDTLGGLSINLSGASLNEEGLYEYIYDLANLLQVPMHKVCFEVTETAGVANLSNASDFILKLKKTGCLFSLDDFGSGMSSYAYLKNLPVDYLKIDGNFIQKMDENPYDFAVVKSITEVGHFMGKKIIAEYVENERILDLLREIGVDYAQGYVIAKPVNLMDVGVLQ